MSEDHVESIYNNGCGKKMMSSWESISAWIFKIGDWY